MNYGKLVRPEVASMKPYTPGTTVSQARKQYGLDTFVKLSSNENPLGTSPKAAAALAAMGDLQVYVDDDHAELRRRLAEPYGFGVEHVLVGHGSNDVVRTLFSAFVASRRRGGAGRSDVLAVPERHAAVRRDAGQGAAARRRARPRRDARRGDAANEDRRGRRPEQPDVDAGGTRRVRPLRARAAGRRGAARRPGVSRVHAARIRRGHGLREVAAGDDRAAHALQAVRARVAAVRLRAGRPRADRVRAARAPAVQRVAPRGGRGARGAGRRRVRAALARGQRGRQGVSFARARAARIARVSDGGELRRGRGARHGDRARTKRCCSAGS